MARSAQGVLARWRAWLQGRTDDLAADASEGTTPPTRADGVIRLPPASLDDVLRDAAHSREDPSAGSGDPIGS